MIGTAPNVFVASFINSQLHQAISFLDWMLLAMPIVILLLVGAWWLIKGWSSGARSPCGTHAVLEGLATALGP
jgi:di/tricarboxylate transporter